MSEARVNNLSNESNTGGPTIAGITTFSGTNFFVPPVGSTAQRPENPQKGAIRFNTDTKHLEYFKGNTLGWTEVEASNEELNGGARGMFAGGQNVPSPTKYSEIDYITISTLGNAIDFGDITDDVHTPAVTASRTRGIAAGGYPTRGDIDYWTIASTGNAIDSGSDLSTNRNDAAPCSDGVRATFAGGYTGSLINTIDYISIASIGTAQDFGDLNNGTSAAAGCESSTRGLIGGGANPGNANTIDFITIATTGNATDFGDLTDARGSLICSFSNSTRGLWAGGYSPGDVNIIDYVTIATLGNATDFGDTLSGVSQAGACASPTRGVIGGGIGGSPSRAHTNVIQYVEISTTGNALDFGDLTVSRNALGACSNAHGGL